MTFDMEHVLYQSWTREGLLAFSDVMALWRVVAVATVVALVGCASDAPAREQRSSDQSTTAVAAEPRAVAEQLAESLSRGNVTAISGPAAQRDLEVLLQGMDGLLPKVEVTDLDEDGNEPRAILAVTWPLPSGVWSYESSALIADDASGAAVEWSSAILHPDLTAATRLVHKTVHPRRADILAEDGSALMTYRPVFRVGLNKPDVSPAEWAASASALAQTLDIDQAKFAAKVEAAGPAAFVEALVVRDTGRGAPAVDGIAGADVIDDLAVLGPVKGFAEGLLGTVGAPTAEQIAKSNGTLAPGMLTGRSGLQLRYDEQLRGSAGGTITMRARSESGPADVTVHHVEPKPGTPLRTSLSGDLQRHAELSLSEVKTPAAFVAINPETGYIRAAATGPANVSAADATSGRYPPGSVFKTVTALALLRQGMTPDSMTECTETVVVDGRRFRNYRDFPRDRLGTMTLRDAIATSCNTALIAQWKQLDGKAIREAAASLGLGQDFETGFPSFMGSAPDPVNTVGLAESIIGQGLIETSPLAMATVTASIQAGRTVTPILLPDSPSAPPSAPPLTSGEAAQLRDMLEETVSTGTGRMLKSLAVGAKTGTAQYGTGDPLPTHAWMIAYDQDLAVAAIVTDGESGSKTVGPVLKTFFG